MAMGDHLHKMKGHSLLINLEYSSKRVFILLQASPYGAYNSATI